MIKQLLVFNLLISILGLVQAESLMVVSFDGIHTKLQAKAFCKSFKQ